MLDLGGSLLRLTCFFFFFNDTATTEIYTLSLHDALPIWQPAQPGHRGGVDRAQNRARGRVGADRKSTRLNSSHPSISYAVFCLKKKKKATTPTPCHPYTYTLTLDKLYQPKSTTTYSMTNF